MSIDPDHIEVRHNPAAQRFETLAGGHLSVAEYRRDGQRILFTHTAVPPALRGQGIAAKLVRVALDYARESGLTVVPLCWYVDAFIRRHPEYRDLLG
ncbi:MAG: GNAT family N-acetyltransferase [Chloroflexaceae bacterium]